MKYIESTLKCYKYWDVLWLSNLEEHRFFGKELYIDLAKWQIYPIKCLQITLKWIRDCLNQINVYEESTWCNGKAYKAGRQKSWALVPSALMRSHAWPSPSPLKREVLSLYFRFLFNKVNPWDSVFSRVFQLLISCFALQYLLYWIFQQ
jgi:hypothetical protein